MKKLFTLSFVMLMTVISFARQPQVIVTVYSMNNSNIDYDVSIDGRMYQGNSIVIPDLYQGTHTLQVYEVRRGGIFGIGRKRTIISSQQFQLRNYDLQVDIDRYGQVRINENGYNNGGWNGRDNNGGWDNNGGYGNDRGCNNKRYDNDNWNNGRGNRYGHYKKHRHGRWEDDDRRGRHDDDDENDDR